jgi:Holliday junction resolvase RusA-like endonuclease
MTDKPKPTKEKPKPLQWADAYAQMLPDGGMRYTMPVSESVNHAYATFNGRRVKSKGLRTGLAEAQKRFPKTPLAGDVGVSITWFRAKRQGDVDNRVKATLDFLKGIAWTDDSAVADLRIIRVDDPCEQARLEVEVWELDRPKRAA